MAVTKLSYKKSVAQAKFILDREICFSHNEPKLVLPWFSSDDEPELKWAIELRTDGLCLEKKDILLVLDRGSWTKDLKASVIVQVTSDVSFSNLKNHCITTAKERKPVDFIFDYGVIFRTYVGQEEHLGSFYICPELMEKLTVRAIIEVTDGTLQEIVEYPETLGQIPMGPSRQVEHQKALSGSFSTLLDSGEFSDIIIRVDERTIPAHRCVLAARSDVFKAMFTSNFMEQSAKEVEVKDVRFDVIELLLRL